MSDHEDSGGFDEDGDDVSDATLVEDFTPEVAAQLGRAICTMAQHLGRLGHGLGGVAIDLGRDGTAEERADALKRAHADGQNVARYVRETLEHVGAANELIGKAARRARLQRDALRG